MYVKSQLNEMDFLYFNILDVAMKNRSSFHALKIKELRKFGMEYFVTHFFVFHDSRIASRVTPQQNVCYQQFLL